MRDLSTSAIVITWLVPVIRVLLDYL